MGEFITHVYLTISAKRQTLGLADLFASCVGTARSAAVALKSLSEAAVASRLSLTNIEIQAA